MCTEESMPVKGRERKEKIGLDKRRILLSYKPNET
jgi:hypothetical protein